MRSLITGIVLAASTATACAGSEPQAGASRATRSAEYEACPPSDITPSSEMVLVDRSLPNLGYGMLGRLETYDGQDRARLEIAVGVDVLDRYEDLDFEFDQIELNGRAATLAMAGAFGSGELVVLMWDEPSVSGVCAQHALVGMNIPTEQLFAMVERLDAV